MNYTINYVGGRWQLYEGCTCNAVNARGDFAALPNTKEIVWTKPTWNAPEVTGLNGTRYRFRNGVGLNVDSDDANSFIATGSAREALEVDKMTAGGYDARVS